MHRRVVREPLDKLDPNHRDLDVWEIVMYVLALAFSFQGEWFWVQPHGLFTIDSFHFD